jgi:hypothetical protein
LSLEIEPKIVRELEPKVYADGTDLDGIRGFVVTGDTGGSYFEAEEDSDNIIKARFKGVNVGSLLDAKMTLPFGPYDYFKRQYGIHLRLRPVISSPGNEPAWIAVGDDTNPDCIKIRFLSGGNIRTYQNGEVGTGTDTGYTWVDGATIDLTLYITADEHEFLVDGISYGTYDNNQDFTDPIKYVEFYETIGGTADMWIERISLEIENRGLDFPLPVEVYEKSGTEVDSKYQPMELADGSILVLAKDEKIYKLTGDDYSTWTMVYDIGAGLSGNEFAAFISAQRDSDDRIIACYKIDNTASNYRSYFLYSDDEGDTWNQIIFAGPVEGSAPILCSDVIDGFGSFHFIGLAPPLTQTFIELWWWDEITPAIDQVGGHTLSGAASVSMMGSRGFISGNEYYSAWNDANYPKFIKINVNPSDVSWGLGATVATIEGTLTTVKTWKTAYTVSTFAFDDEAGVIFDDTANAGTCIINLWDTNVSRYVLYETFDGGNTWDRRSTSGIDVSGVSETLYIAGDPITYRKYYIEKFTDSLTIRYYFKQHFTKRVSVPFPANYDEMAGITTTGVFFLNSTVATATKIYSFTNQADLILSILIEEHGNEKPSKCDFQVPVEFSDLFAAGDVEEFYDGFGQLIGKYRVIDDSEFGNTGGILVKCAGLNQELLSNYSEYSNIKRFDNKTSDEIVIQIANDLSFIYQDSSIATFVLAYYREVNQPITNFFNFLRQLEKALIYTEPDGRLRFHAFADAIDTGLLFAEGDNQLQFLRSRRPDHKITRSMVTGAWNRDREVFVPYIGDPDLNSDEGSSGIHYEDSQILDHPEGYQLAVNRFDIFNAPTYYVHIQLANQGHIQAGELISFRFDESQNYKEVPFGLYVLSEYKYDPKRDYYFDMILSDGQSSEEEYFGVKKTTKKDSNVRSKSTNSTTESTVTLPPTYQNPINRLAAGTYVPRRPAPGQYDWYWDGVTHVPIPAPNGEPNTWNPVDVSSIVPEGVRAIDLKVIVNNGTPGNFMLFNENGLGNLVTSKAAYNISAVGLNPYDFVVPITEARFFEWYSNINRVPGGPPPIPGWDEYYIVICGWWI